MIPRPRALRGTSSVSKATTDNLGHPLAYVATLALILLPLLALFFLLVLRGSSVWGPDDRAKEPPWRSRVGRRRP